MTDNWADPEAYEAVLAEPFNDGHEYKVYEPVGNRKGRDYLGPMFTEAEAECIAWALNILRSEKGLLAVIDVDEWEQGHKAGDQMRVVQQSDKGGYTVEVAGTRMARVAGVYQGPSLKKPRKDTAG